RQPSSWTVTDEFLVLANRIQPSGIRPGMKTFCGLLLVVASVLWAPGPAPAASPTCHGVKATIVGTAHRDTIVGTSHRDVIVAGRGTDVGDARGDNYPSA